MHCAVASHRISRAPYGPVERANFTEMVKSISATLPCPVCRMHFTKAIERGGESIFETIDALEKFLVDTHNEVNLSLGKPTVPYADVPKMLQSSSCTSDAGHQTWILVLLVAIFLAFGLGIIFSRRVLRS